MEFKWTSFILEIINFIVLVWILQRFLYKPIKNIIKERKETVQKTLAEADKAKKDAADLQAKYENRLQEWEQEKQEKLAALANEMQIEKQKQLTDLKNLLATEKEKNLNLEKERIADLINKKEKTAIAQGLKFLTVLLKQFADHNLENNIISAFLERLSKMPQENIDALKKAASNNTQTLLIKSAYQLSEEQKNTIIKAFENLLSPEKINISYAVDPEMISGINASIGAIVLRADLRDELELFAKSNFNG